MGWIKELDDAMSKNYKLRYLIYTLLFLLIVAAGTFIYILIKNANNNNGVKFGSLEVPPNKKTDTPNTISIIDTTKKDSQSLHVPYNPVKKRTSSKKDEAIKQENKEGDNNSVGRDNKGVQGGKDNRNHVVEGNMYGGINGDITILNGIKQRHLNEELLNRIKEKLPTNKTDLIHFKYPFDDKEASNFSDEIALKLRQMGYPNLENGPGEMYFTDSVLLTIQNGQLYIGVSKESNISQK